MSELRKIFKNRIAWEHYGKKWIKLTFKEQMILRTKFKDQFEYFKNIERQTGHDSTLLKGDMKMDNETDHDLLIQMDVKLDELKLQFTNHLKHHATYTYLAFATMLGLIGTLITFILTK